MQLTLHKPENAILVQSYRDRRLKIANEWHDQALFLRPGNLEMWNGGQDIKNWGKEDVEKLSVQACEMLIIGCGEKHILPSPRVTAFLNQQGIGLETMSTEAACRTWNILVTDGRDVAAVLIP